MQYGMSLLFIVYSLAKLLCHVICMRMAWLNPMPCILHAVPMQCSLHATLMSCICMPHLCHVFARLVSPFSYMPRLLKANYTISAHRCMENRFIGLHCHSSHLTHRVLPITHWTSFIHWLLITHCSLFVAYHALFIACFYLLPSSSFVV